MQTGNYRAYATMPRNEFSTNDQDLRNNPKRSDNCLVRVFARDLRIYGGLIVDLMIGSSLSFAVFVF